MRKWIAGLLALSALTPIAASAQDGRERGERGAGWQRGPRAELRADADVDARDGPRSAPQDRRPDRGPRGDDGRGREQRGVRADVAVGGGIERRDWQNRGDPAPARQDWRGRSDLDARADRPQRRDDRPLRDGNWQQRDAPRPGGWQQRDDRRDLVQRRDRGRDDWSRSRFDDRDDRWTQSRFADRANWNRGWRSDGRYDWNRYRASNRNAFRLPRYYAPGGWNGGYRRFQVGVGLQASLWSRNYWIDDPYSYRLPEAYGPYRWVRYYDDALLVDVRTGVVVDTAYGIFW